MKVIETKYDCRGCEKTIKKQVSFDNNEIGNCHLCEKCLIKAYCLITGKKFLNWEGYIFEEPTARHPTVMQISKDKINFKFKDGKFILNQKKEGKEDV